MTRGLKIAGIVCAAVVGAVLSVAYYFIDPAQSHLMPRCLFKVVTGWDCPGCGSQRMLHALLHGDFAAAWGANPFLLAISPFVMLLGVAAATRKRWPRLYRAVNSAPVVLTFLAALVAWFILRNVI